MITMVTMDDEGTGGIAQLRIVDIVLITEKATWLRQKSYTKPRTILVGLGKIIEVVKVPVMSS